MHLRAKNRNTQTYLTLLSCFIGPSVSFSLDELSTDLLLFFDYSDVRNKLENEEICRFVPDGMIGFFLLLLSNEGISCVVQCAKWNFTSILHLKDTRWRSRKSKRKVF